jgi:hypothetical protein
VKKTKPFLCSYHHDGAEWSLTIHAYSFEDATERVKKLGYLRLDGELIAEIPAKLGLLPKLACWIRNTFSNGGMK